MPTPDELATLREDFPDFHIWREVTGDRTRYTAQRQRAGVRPHTVVTTDLAELRSLLADAPAAADSRQAANGGLA
jgi:hypothetical protein